MQELFAELVTAFYLCHVNFKIEMIEVSRKGYVMVPRQLIHDAICECPAAPGEKDALLRVLLYANYKESVYRRNGVEYVCARGESLFSYVQWAEILGWTRSRTMRFFRRMLADGQLVHVDDGFPTHIRIPHYDVWAPRSSSHKEVAAGTPSDNGFHEFWEQYHEMTRKDKVNPAKARKEWNKLSANERAAALENIENYYIHLTDTKFCLQAVNYLSYKAFLNEYEY